MLYYVKNRTKSALQSWDKTLNIEQNCMIIRYKVLYTMGLISGNSVEMNGRHHCVVTGRLYVIAHDTTWDIFIYNNNYLQI